jgi:predicted phage terminase large subunit-like protein
LLDAMQYTQHADYGAVIFRRIAEQVFQEGGLWETSERMYPYAGAEPRRAGPQWVFPSGATISFGGLEHEDSKINWLGAQIPYLGFDQLEAFTRSQFLFMLGCNRSPVAGVKPCVRATANPEPGWLADFIQWWWNPDTGYPIPERSGVVRWFVNVKDRIFWADSADELVRKFPGQEIVPKSFTFILALVDDNPALLESDPQYKANLHAQGTVEQERWLKGNWKIKMTGGMLLQRAWFKIAELRPARFDRLMRYWDFAATEETDKNKNPCYTAGALVGIVGGVWYVMDIKRVRSNPPEVEGLVKQMAKLDPRNAEIRIEREPGSAGKFVLSHFQRNVLVGYAVTEGDLTWNRQNKTERAKAIATAAKAGNVFLVQQPGGDNGWIENFLTDCDSAPEGWMDMIDSVSGAFGEMRDSVGGNQIKKVELPELADARMGGERRGLW